MVPSIVLRILKSFRYAWQGLKTTFTTQSNFKIHCLGFAFMNASALFFNFEKWEYISCLILSSMVFMAELFNTAIETTVNICAPEMNPLAKTAKDCAAGAVLILAIGAVIVWGIIVFSHS
jgi:diacylglycerol kinase